MEPSEGVIYPPPKNGLPFLVVTFSNGNMQTQPAGSRSEARILLSRERTRRRSAELHAVSGEPALVK